MLRNTNMSHPSVILSHAGVQYSYHVAFTLQEAGFLKGFWTTLYDFNHHNGTSWIRGLNRRHYEGLKKELIHSHPWPEVFQRAFVSLLGRNYFTTNRLLQWRNRWFDSHVANQLDRDSFDCFMGYAGSCLTSVKRTKKLGRWAIVDQHDVHPAIAERLLKEEIELNPDFAPLISYWPPDRGYLERLGEELELADQILVPSSFSLSSHRQEGIPRKKLFCIPLGVDIPASPLDRKKKRKPFRILFVGTISQRKGIKYLLEAVKQLRLPESELVLAGQIDGDPRPLNPYKDFFRHVGFLSREAMREYWESSHVLVLSSIYDALGLVILEAMAHGVPVIVSENTIGLEAVRDGSDGFVVPIRDVEALKDRILRLYENRRLCDEMGQNASERAREFTWEKYGEKLTAFLRTTSCLPGK